MIEGYRTDYCDFRPRGKAQRKGKANGIAKVGRRKGFGAATSRVGESILDTEAIIALLIEKGIFAAKEWQTARDHALVERGLPSEVALRHVRDLAALHTFFGNEDDSGR